MRTLNDPVGGDENPADDAEWTPQIGLRRAALRGAILCVVLCALTGLLAWFLPAVTINIYLRSFLAFVVAWLLFSLVQDAAGFVGFPVSAIAIGYTLIVLISHHVIFALHGVPSTKGVMIGSIWLDPLVLFGVNFGPLGAIAFATALCHRGVPGGGVLTDLLMSRRGWGSR